MKVDLTDSGLPRMEEHDKIARVVDFRGSNIMEVELPEGGTTLARLPSRFQKLAWVKKGGYLVIQQGDQDGTSKVDSEIKSVLYATHVKEMKREGLWPLAFDSGEGSCNDSVQSKEYRERTGHRGKAEGGSDEQEDSDHSLPPLVPNRNHRLVEFCEESEDSGEFD